MREILDIAVGDLMSTAVVTVTPETSIEALDTWVSSVGAIMSRGVITLYPVEPALKAVALMVEHRIRSIPIVTDSAGGPTVAGILTRRDLAAALKP